MIPEIPKEIMDPKTFGYALAFLVVYKLLNAITKKKETVAYVADPQMIKILEKMSEQGHANKNSHHTQIGLLKDIEGEIKTFSAVTNEMAGQVKRNHRRISEIKDYTKDTNKDFSNTNISVDRGFDKLEALILKR